MKPNREICKKCVNFKKEDGCVISLIEWAFDNVNVNKSIASSLSLPMFNKVDKDEYKETVPESCPFILEQTLR